MSHVYECICVIDNLLSVVTQLGQFLSFYIAICNPCCLIYIQFVYVQYSFNLLLPPFEVYRYDNEKYTHIYHRWCLCQKTICKRAFLTIENEMPLKQFGSFPMVIKMAIEFLM